MNESRRQKHKDSIIMSWWCRSDSVRLRLTPMFRNKQLRRSARDRWRRWTESRDGFKAADGFAARDSTGCLARHRTRCFSAGESLIGGAADQSYRSMIDGLKRIIHNTSSTQVTRCSAASCFPLDVRSLLHLHISTLWPALMHLCTYPGLQLPESSAPRPCTAQSD